MAASRLVLFMVLLGICNAIYPSPIIYHPQNVTLESVSSSDDHNKPIANLATAQLFSQCGLPLDDSDLPQVFFYTVNCKNQLRANPNHETGLLQFKSNGSIDIQFDRFDIAYMVHSFP